MKFSIITLGCKVNTYESEAMKELLIKDGYIYNENYQNSDIVIVNTCSVTNMADTKSKKIIRRVKRENPNCILVVCGCSSQNHKEEYEELDIDILLGNVKKSMVSSLIKNYLEDKRKYYYITDNRDLGFESMSVKKFTKQTRAYLKIQDGCNNFCSYCIIPYVRGTIRFKNFTECLKEACILVNSGHKEIVLTGIHTGSYHDSGHDLVDLIHELKKIDGLEQIRISSIEITELNDKFMEELKTNPKICDHIHIPLQSGSNYILKKMNRKYDCNYYRDKINLIRSIRKDISITTDVIVGHPYETEEYFNESYNFCKEMNFSKIHVFPYSKRDGTPASKMPYQVSEAEKKDRDKRLIALSNNLEEAYYKKHLNKRMRVLVEEVDGDTSYGHTSNYLKVKMPARERGTFVTVKLEEYDNFTLIAKK